MAIKTESGVRKLADVLEDKADGRHLTRPFELSRREAVRPFTSHFQERREPYGYSRTISPFMIVIIVAELDLETKLDEA